MNASWLVPMLTAGFLGSVHCVGMCGGFVTVASGGTTSVRERVRVQCGYQLARLASYLTLGALAGGLGQALDLAGQAAGLAGVAAVIAGGSMTLWGLWAMLEAGGARFKFRRVRAWLLPSFVRGRLEGLQRRGPLARAALLGGVSAFLPCGFLYAFALAAAATGSVIGGGLVMAALWLGNLPALLGFGLVVSGALSRLRRHVPFCSAVIVFVLGVFTLHSRVQLPAFAVAALVNGSHVTAGPAPRPMPADCPYHRKAAP